MKTTILFLFIGFAGLSQKAVFNKIDHAGTFTEYQTKSGGVLKINDTITIGYPLGKEFTFLTQGDLNVAARLSNTKVVIAKIKAIGNNIRGYKIYALFKGYGAAVYIDYEAALETREIIDPFTSNTQKD
jgi:hypothetical protein